MASAEDLKALCYDEQGRLKTKPECRSALINHLILEDMMDVMDAEDLTDKTLRDLKLWPEEPRDKEAAPGDPEDLSTPAP